MEHAVVNEMYKEVMCRGPGAMDKLQKKVNNRQVVQALLEDLVEVVMDVVRVKAKRSLWETKQLEWRRRWEALE